MSLHRLCSKGQTNDFTLELRVVDFCESDFVLLFDYSHFKKATLESNQVI
jgi:hypothetical protein